MFLQGKKLIVLQKKKIIKECNISLRLKNHVPITPPYHWPVTVAECHGKESSCRNSCSEGVIKDLCSQACAKYYRCDAAGSPPSGLKVDEADQAPIYHLPVSRASVLLPYSSTIIKFLMLILTLIFI
jgi:hypothetical protein